MFRALIRSLRPRQWLKNGFILAAIVFDRQLTNPTALLHTLAGVVLFCLISSSVYLINDIMDLEADRNHPKKRLRPIASGQLPISMAIITAIGFNVISLPVSLYISQSFFIIALVYFVLNLAYSKWLKHIPLIDVMVLASGFVLRVAAGVSLIQVERFSPWLYVVTTLLALYILLGKRRAELSLLAKDANLHRPVLEGYTIPFLDQLIIIVSSTTIIAYSLYTFSAPNLPENHSMMLTIPFVLYGILRYLYLVQVKQEGGAPEDIVLADRPLQAAIGLWGLGVLVIFYLIPALG
jgi:4-hydroxybenzoate polyprenyltransferase